MTFALQHITSGLDGCALAFGIGAFVPTGLVIEPEGVKEHPLHDRLAAAIAEADTGTLGFLVVEDPPCLCLRFDCPHWQQAEAVATTDRAKGFFAGVR